MIDLEDGELASGSFLSFKLGMGDEKWVKV